MLHRLLPAYIVILVTGCGSETSSSAARAVISWRDFEPACLRLVAQNGAEGEQKTVTLPVDDRARTGERVVAVFRGRDWNAEVRLLAEALEGSCEGPVVARQLQTVVLTSGIVAADFSLVAKDVDADGFVDATATLPGGDCDDATATVNPNATEVCDGVDNDCRDGVDDGVSTLFYADVDRDGFGNAQNTVRACALPPGFLTTAGDCNDENAAVHPDANDTCNGVDDNCNGDIDEGSDRSTFYRDADADGFGDPQAAIQACQQPQGYVVDASDCNDQSPDVHPGATEVCNGADDDCNAVVDEGVKLTFFPDQDADGYGSNLQMVSACVAPAGHVAQGGDCDDGDPLRAPGLPEICDLKDNDCDGKTDEGATTTFYADTDGDGHGAVGTTVQACTAPAGYVAVATDCDDKDAQKAPGLTETCDQKDNDCDGQVDEGVQTTFYRDQDGDGYGTTTTTKAACTPPAGYAAVAGDCNDTNPSIHPNAAETCNGADDDCDGQTDEGVTSTYYADRDQDGYGNTNETVVACAATPGVSSASGDCDDGNPFRRPGLAEVCDGLDNDCDGTADDGVSCGSYSWRNPQASGVHGHDWRRAAAFVGGAWAAGFDEANPSSGRLRSWTSSNQAGAQADGSCGGSWYAAWANPSSQEVYLGGAEGELAVHPNGNSCGTTTSFGSSSIRGVAGVPDASTGALVIYGATSGGTIFKWRLGANDTTEVAEVPSTIFDFDAIRENLGYAVGAKVTGSGQTVPFIIRATGVGTWAQDTLPGGGGLNGVTLRAVSVASADGYAAAVGDSGLVLVRDPKANSWATLPSSPASVTALRGVVAFGKNLIYVVGTSNNGSSANAWRWDGLGWTTLQNTNLTSTPQDIHGLSPHDLWIVGSDGMVRHWSP